MTRLAILLRSALLILTLICVSQTMARSQKYKVTIKVKEQRLLDVFKTIQKQTNLIVFYSNTILNDQEKVSIQVKDEPLERVLDKIVFGKALKYEVQEKYIVISPKEEKETQVVTEDLSLRVDITPAPPSTIDVSGRITDEDGNPLMGASVMIKGTKLGTQTNAEGYFILKGVDEKAVLEISYVGFANRIISVTGFLAIRKLELKRNDSPLDVIQVEAYRTNTRRLSTSNINTVKAADIEKQPVNNPILALQARVPGLQVTQSSGVPGAGLVIRIQGVNSLSNGSDPLFVIDGVPYTSQTLETTFGGSGVIPKSEESSPGLTPSSRGGAGNPLAFINPSDIESIDVLKDADATAIYGSRAANGAILITTKKAKAGQTRYDVNIQNGWGRVTRFLDVMNTQQYLEMRREAFKNDNIAVPSLANSPTNTEYDINGHWDTTRNTNWQKELIGGTASYTNANAAVSGGNDRFSFRLAGTYQRETSVFLGEFSDRRASVHLNLNSVSANNKFRTQFSATYLHSNNQLPGIDFTSQAVRLAPNAPAMLNADGTLNYAPLLVGSTVRSTFSNPLGRLVWFYENKTGNMVSNLLLSYRIVPGLEVKSSFGYTNLQTDEFYGVPLTAFLPESRSLATRTADYSDNRISSWIIEPQLSYRRKIGNGKIDLLVGSTFYSKESDGTRLQGSGYISDEVLRSPKAAGTLTASGSVISQYRYSALFGRAEYNLSNRYLINLTMRRDGSSRFGENSRIHNFGAVGMGWIFSDESFIRKNISFLSFGKIRGSYGTTGSDQVGDYSYMPLYSPINPSVLYQGTSGLRLGGINNSYLEWEETRKLQMGLDIGMFKDWLLFTVNYVDNRCSNQLLDYALPLTTGVGAVALNFPATVQNTAWEFSFSSINLNSNTLKWSTNINLTIPNNRLLKFENIEKSAYTSSLVVGQPIGIFKRYKFYGVDPLTGSFVVADKNGLPTNSPNFSEDAVVLMNTQQKFYGGLSNTLEIGGFQLDILFQFVKQLGSNYLTSNPPGRYVSAEGNQPVWVLDRWQNPGDVSSSHRFTTTTAYNTTYNYARLSDLLYSDASFIRLKNLSLSYRFSENTIKRAHLQNLRLYAHAQNLLTITKFRGMDPENQSASSLPPLRMITVGIQVGL